MSRKSDDSRKYTLESEATDLAIPNFYDDPKPIITSQPTKGESVDHVKPAIQWDGAKENRFIPSSGIDSLAGTNQLIIHRTGNNKNFSTTTPHRYNIKIPSGDNLYYGTESSSNFQRLCNDKNRKFTIKLMDQTSQEALTLTKRSGSCCWGGEMKVEAYPEDLLGTIKQVLALVGRAKYSIRNQEGLEIFKIAHSEVDGKDTRFKIYSDATQIGSIYHQWDAMIADYCMWVQYPGSINVKEKALILGGAFALLYAYFEKSNSMCTCLTRCCFCYNGSL